MNPWQVCSSNFLIIHKVVNKCKAGAGQEEAMIAKFLAIFSPMYTVAYGETYPNKLIDDSGFT